MSRRADIETVASGLSEAEAQRRLAERGPVRKPAASRSYASIVRHNVFTLPNTVLGLLGILTVALGEAADAIFLGIVVANALIGSVQEIRAKRALEQLAALVKPTAQVVRDGRARELDVGDVVRGDLVLVEPGDQIVADGEVVAAEALRIDESILTGESEPVGRDVGEQVLSGSFAVEGTGSYVVTAVGAESYAERLAGEARAFRHPPSPFQIGLNRLIVTLVAVGGAARRLPRPEPLAARDALRRGSPDRRRRRDQHHPGGADPPGQPRLSLGSARSSPDAVR